MLPLDGITVVALEQAVAAPFASRQLADLGARVIKIERPGGGDFARGYDAAVQGMASYFVWLNRSKESLTLDLSHPEACDILRSLLQDADIFLHNLAPGGVDRLGFGADRLRSDFPRLIICTISGYGTTGPYRDKRAYDLLVQAETGVVSVTGTPEHPAKCGVSIADIGAGMYAYSGCLAALFARTRTGDGMAFEVSLFDALVEWMSAPAYFASYSGTPPPRTGANHATIAPYGTFPSGSGRDILLGVQNEREWERFCRQVLDRPELLEDPRLLTIVDRTAHRDELTAIIAQVFSTMSEEEITQRLDDAQIANAHMTGAEELWAHPQLQDRGRWTEVETPNGAVRAVYPPTIVPGMQPRMDPIPAIGEQTARILQGLGYDESRIETLRQKGAV